ncbi:MAG: hypothetical protein PHE99_05235 [Bacteroidales bacterium]|nr:hypothetical protein [Bacteroidales bacterium]
MKKWFWLLLLVAFCLALLFFGYRFFRDDTNQLVCILYPEIFIDETIKAFAKDYRASSGYSAKFAYVNKYSEVMNTAIPKMLEKLKSDPERYDVIMLVSNPNQQFEEEIMIASYIDESTIVKLNDYLSLGVNKLSKNHSQAIDLIEDFAREYKLGWFYKPAWERKKLKISEQ